MDDDDVPALDADQLPVRREQLGRGGSLGRELRSEGVGGAPGELRGTGGHGRELPGSGGRVLQPEDHPAHLDDRHEVGGVAHEQHVAVAELVEGQGAGTVEAGPGHLPLRVRLAEPVQVPGDVGMRAELFNPRGT
ncbi:UNVERIFIED_CONTAM: hypothetical protein QYM44_07550 [Kocuria sp. CPCC 205315]